MRQVLLFVLLFTLVVADELQYKKTLNEKSAVADRRIRNKFKLFPFGLLGFGGLNVLSWFVAIKFKLIVIFLFIVGAVILGAKVLAGKSLLGCSSSGIEHITPYHSSESVEYSSFPGASGGSGESTYLDHPPTGYSSSSGGYPSGPAAYGGSYNSGHSEITADEPYPSAQKRILKTRSIDDSENGRAEDDDEDEEIDLADITFAVLGVQKRACKKRFVCEFDFRSQMNPFFRIAYKFIRNGMFPKYATLTEMDVKQFGDCRKLFPTCMTPSEEQDQLSEQEATTEATNDDEEADSAAEAESNEISAEKETSSPKPNSEKVGRLILRRVSSLGKFL